MLQARPSPIPVGSFIETRELLERMVAIDTSNPPGNELKVAEMVRPILESEGVEVRVFETAPGRGNLWARIKGTGKRKPLLLAAHIDVVGAKREDWKSDPFQVIERGGYLYGRGVIDDKGMAAALVTVMKLLKRNHSLERDVILFLGADEEAGSEWGILWMLKHHPELIQADLVINEGGPMVIEGGRLTHLALQSYEKLYMDVTLSTEGTSGHSSIPSRDNAIGRLARAVDRVAPYQFPVNLNPVTRAYFEGLTQVPNHPLATQFRILTHEDDGPDWEEAVARISEEPTYNAYLRTTCTPTIFKAGFRENAIPGRAEANVNCRLLPTENAETVVRRLRDAIGDPKVTLTPTKPRQPAMSPVDHPIFESLRAVMKEIAPGAVVVPYMSAGATDSAKLRLKGINAYGLLPFPMTAEDKARMHGNDERLSVESLKFGTEFLYRLVVSFAGVQGR